MAFLWMSLFAVAIVVADQLVKYWIVTGIPLYDHVPFLDGVLRLTYVQNTGAAFSFLQGARWFFVALFGVITILLLYEYFFKRQPFTKLERWCLAAIYGGGLGNLIDRIRLGYVVDMFETEFIKFPVFNVADCFITCGCILLMVHLVFFNKAFWKDEKK